MSALVHVSSKWARDRDICGKSTPPDGDESVADFVRRKFSKQLLDRLADPFVSGIYAGDPERLSIRSAFPQLYEAEKSAGSIVRGMLRLAKSSKGPRQRSTLQSFPEGNETLERTLAKQLGPALLTETIVTAISRQTDRSFDLRLEYRVRDESGSARSYNLATPPVVTAVLLSPLDSSFETLLGSIEYAAVAVFSLGYRKKCLRHSLDGFA